MGISASRQGPCDFGFRMKTEGMTKLNVRLVAGWGHFILKDSCVSMSASYRWCWTRTWSPSICRWGSKHTHDSSGFPPWRESLGSSARWPIQHGSAGWKSGKLLALTCETWDKSACSTRKNVARCIYMCMFWEESQFFEWLLRPDDIAWLSIITVFLYFMKHLLVIFIGLKSHLVLIHLWTEWGSKSVHKPRNRIDIGRVWHPEIIEPTLFSGTCGLYTKLTICWAGLSKFEKILITVIIVELVNYRMITLKIIAKR